MAPKKEQEQAAGEIEITDRLLREATGESDLLKGVAADLHDRNIKHLAGLERVPGLRTLDLSFNKVAKADELAVLKQLREVKLYDNCVSSLMGLAPLTLLHTLELGGNRITQMQGVSALVGLKVLRLAYNQISSLEGLGRHTGLEVLDLSFNRLQELTALTGCRGLKELTVSGNQLVNFEGLSACVYLEEVHATDNQLVTLAGLPMPFVNPATKEEKCMLDVLNVSSNCLTSIKGLNKGAVKVTELYIAGNQISSLVPLATRTPAVETLDVAENQLSDLVAVAAALAPLTGLSSLRMEGNPCTAATGYQSQMLAGVTQLESVDDVDRPTQIWVNPDAGADVTTAAAAAAGASSAGDEDGAAGKADGGEGGEFDPTVAEMEEFKRRMGIVSDLPVLGRPGTSGTSTRPTSAHSMRNSVAALRPGSGDLRPGTASRPGSAMGGRPASAGGGQPVRDVMMHQRPPSARTGGSAKLMTPQQYRDAVVDFKGTMDAYSSQLRTVLSRIKAGLKLSVTEAAAALAQPGSAAARQLPPLPEMVQLPLYVAPVGYLGDEAAAAAAAAAAAPAATGGSGKGKAQVAPRPLRAPPRAAWRRPQPQWASRVPRCCWATWRTPRGR